MRHRDKEEFDNLDDILYHLGDPERVGKNMTWVAKNYSLQQLILDLRKLRSENE
ncbi:hypothetical protein Hena1_01910 [Erwinia phage Hena1]|uniref:Uncharacterized protein n=1 Tax=Erwinia phage Hena1 TaxID=2678601 RepID=A0A6B9J5V7_9CAUD|nr:hypothetical protein HWC84_gp173 [Erwinia phage Hena1]QGZ16341.1 hypothetical protein Hena1_01910 [Erwinia phage Hena1]